MFVPVLCAETDIAQIFVADLLGAVPGAVGEVDIGGLHVFVEPVATPDPDDAGLRARLKQADAAAILVHFLDSGSLDAAGRLLTLLPREPAIPVGVFIFRADEEPRFKISCEECGQRLWVLEKEVGLRGRCANCRKPMRIPSPSERVRTRMRLADYIPILNVVRGDAGLARGALANLLARVGTAVVPGTALSSQEFLKSATVPIQLPSSPPA